MKRTVRSPVGRFEGCNYACYAYRYIPDLPTLSIYAANKIELKLCRGHYFEVSIPVYKRRVAAWYTSARPGLQKSYQILSICDSIE